MLDTVRHEVRSHLRLASTPDIDGVLIQWGDRLFYPDNRVVKVKPQAKLSALAARQRAAAIRARIEAAVVRRVAQVMVKVTGGGRGMKAIAARSRCAIWSRIDQLIAEMEQAHAELAIAVRFPSPQIRIGST